jgi:hypothetical protein
MKRFLFILLLIPAQTLFCQLQLRISGEYGFPLQKDFMTSYDTSNNRTLTKGSYGNGIVLNFGIGKGFNKNASGYIDLSYSTSKEFKSSSYSPDGRTLYSNISRGTYFSITPSLLVKAAGKKLDPYVRFGVIAAFPMIREVREFTDQPEGDNIYEYRGGLTLGALGAAGLEFSSGDGASLFLEVVSRNMIFHPKELVNVETYDGQPVAPTAKFTENPGGTELPSVSRTFSSVGISFGVRLSIFSGPATADY